MKLRIQGDTIRIRVNDNEVSQLQSGQSLVSATHFPGNVLEIKLTPENEDYVSYDNGQILIGVKMDKIMAWAESDEITIPMEFAVSDDKKLSILVEKDMKV